MTSTWARLLMRTTAARTGKRAQKQFADTVSGLKVSYMYAHLLKVSQKGFVAKGRRSYPDGPTQSKPKCNQKRGLS